MLRHLFKMIWNKKKQNFLLITEIFVSFLVLFVVFSILVFKLKSHNRPRGFFPDNVWAITIQVQNANDSTKNYHEAVARMVRSLPETEEVAWTGFNFPYAASSSNSNVAVNGRNVMVEFHDADDTYGKVLGAKLLEGRWYGKQDDGSAGHPVVINQEMKEKLFGNESPVGKYLPKEDGSKGDRIVGVVQNMKEKGDYSEEGAAMYKRIDKTPGGWHPNVLLVSFREPQDANFEGKLHKQLSTILKGANIEIEYLKAKQANMNTLALTPVIVLMIVCSFLVLNVCLGLFGVLWYNINRRKGEIGLRRAVGATGSGITRHFIAEAMVLTTLALLLGFFFAVQFPLLNVFDVAGGVYLMAILLSAAFIYALVLICAFYPGKQAAGIYPAVALHEN